MYRVSSNEEGRRILKEIALVLSEDDHFVDASTHKVISFSSEDKCASLAVLSASHPQTELLGMFVMIVQNQYSDN